MNAEQRLEKKLDLLEHGRLHYSSSPDRGLDNILYLLPWIRDKIPEINLHVYYSFFNWVSAAKARGNANEMAQIEEMQKKIEEHKDCVIMHGRVSQVTLAKEWWKAWCWFYPTNFTETYCCVPGTNIRTSDGLKRIENITSGDTVLSHLGICQRVINTMMREVNEPIYSLRSTYQGKPLQVTGNHPLYVMRERTKCKRTHTAECKPSRRCLAGTINGSLYHSDCDWIGKVYQPEWVNASEVKIGDYLCYPINKNNEIPKRFSDYIKIDFDSYFKHPLTTRFDDFEIDNDFLEICGWYSAEGSFDQRGNTVKFSLNILEEHECNFIANWFNKIGIRTHTVVIDNVRQVNVYSSIIGQFFVENFGEGSKKIAIPKWVRDLDKNYLKYYIRGLLQGDGSEKENTYRINCASESLVNDLFDVLLKFGSIGSIVLGTKPKPYRVGKKIFRDDSIRLPCWTLEVTKGQNQELESFLGYVPYAIRGQLFIHDVNNAYFKVHSITQSEYTGPVYNFEVENDNSYIADNIIVHNCLTADEAMISVTPIICTDLAALTTTVGDYGTRIPPHAYSREGRTAFLEAIVKLTDKDYWMEQALRAARGADRRISWGNRVEDYWEKLI